jgi:hypothetical protein
MRMTALFRSVTVVACVSFGLNLTIDVVSAQNILQRAKRAAEEAAKKAREKEQPHPATPAPQGANPPRSPAAPAAAASGDCCSPDALRKIAASAGTLDIVGIKLGMTPEQAFAAVAAFNPRMKIDIIKAGMDNPEDPSGSTTPVSQYALAHTVGALRPPAPTAFSLADFSSDAILIEFSVLPNPPLVVRIVREVHFPRGQLVVGSTLLDALRKKYGQESPQGLHSMWVFDVAGKPVSRPLEGPEGDCIPTDPRLGLPWGGVPGPQAVEGVSPVPLSAARLDQDGNPAACRPFAFVVAYPLGQHIPPNQQTDHLIVSVQNSGLLYGSRKATRDWLTAKADAKTKQQEDAAKARSAPKL